ncbi:hypothetical protein [Streptomyces rishiriensis]|uniref:hypothetical protein n=1 Tax=Streptomyces rishiriensis TaxID=68264 RepID=UPI0037D5ADDA
MQVRPDRAAAREALPQLLLPHVPGVGPACRSSGPAVPDASVLLSGIVERRHLGITGRR